MISAKNVHIVGIGGIGTSAVAKWFLARGATVSGSDVHESSIVEGLRKRGVDVRLGHFAENVPRECDLLVYTRAADATNVERQYASGNGITQMSYPEFLGALAKEHRTIAVSGTNGKSTTTAMIAHMLIAAGLDPTVIVGTQVPGWDDGNLHIGEGDWLVVEACEHMESMLEIAPNIAVVTNIEEDHLDYYRDLDHIREAFQKWIDSADQVVLNAQDEQSSHLDDQREERSTGINRSLADARDGERVYWFDMQDREVGDDQQMFRVDNERYRIPIPGAFNCANAAAAVRVGKMLELEQETIVEALATFPGTWRRFEKVGTWKKADIFSDYAHHPTAVVGAIEAFKEFYPSRRLVVVFEPHQHSRTHEMFDQFVESFDQADVLILSEIYEVAGRTEERFESSKDMADHVRNRGTIEKVLYAKDLNEAEDHLRYIVEKEDVIVCMGAGSIDSLARKLV